MTNEGINFIDERKARRHEQRALYRQRNRFILIAIILVIATAIITSSFVKENVMMQTSEVTVRVSPYDSIWGLCNEHCPSSLDMRDYVEIVEKYNGLDGATIYAGDTLKIPVFEEVSLR